MIPKVTEKAVALIIPVADRASETQKRLISQCDSKHVLNIGYNR